MSVVERLRKTGQYVGEVASKSVGIGWYQQLDRADKLKKEMDHPNASAQIEKMMVTFLLTLTPATMNFSVSKEEDESSDPKIRSKFITGVKFLSTLSVDLSPLVTPMVVSSAFHSPLPLLGLLGKPLCNAVVQVTSDIVDARAFRKKDSPKANSGTYGLLEKAHSEFYDPKLKAAVVRDSQGKVTATVLKEAVCARTGGSCMELVLSKREGEERWLEGTHVTEKDVIVNISSEKTPEATPPKIEDLMRYLKSLVN